MIPVSSQSAVVRARWLTELAAALDEAHRLSLRLATCQPDTGEAIALRARIVALRRDVESLRRGNRSKPVKHDPIWLFHRHWRQDPE